MQNRSQDNEEMDKCQSEPCSSVDAYACASTESGICMSDQVDADETAFVTSTQYCDENSTKASSTNNNNIALNAIGDIEIVTVDLTEHEDSYFDDADDSMELDNIEHVSHSQIYLDTSETNICKTETIVDYHSIEYVAIDDTLPAEMSEEPSQCTINMPRPAGELVWAALSSFPFWPAIISYPSIEEQHLLSGTYIT